MGLEHMEGSPAVSKVRGCGLDLGQGLQNGKGGWTRGCLGGREGRMERALLINRSGGSGKMKEVSMTHGILSRHL